MRQSDAIALLASHHFPRRLPNFLSVKYLPCPSFFTTVGEKRRGEKRRKIPKLSHHTFFSLSRFRLASGMAEGARAGCSMHCFPPIKALTRWIFFHFHKVLHTVVESSGKRSCQGTLSRGADASGERKVETMSENGER